MIDHIGIKVSDLERSIAFYEKALGVIGYRRIKGRNAFTLGKPEDVNGCGSVWLSQRSENKKLTQNIHIAFKVKDIEVVKKFYDVAIAAGGRDNGEPGLCPEYDENYYGGFVFDPDGNNIEAMTILKI
jgi:catechol 2,3-dioxygenase-like lactoylglutathione lyase family enzyme